MQRNGRDNSVRAVVLLVALALPAWIAAPTATVRAAAIVVTSTADTVMMGDGCTLREAIQAANTDAAVNECAAGVGADVIDASGVSGTITLGSALPAIASNMTIRGPAASNLTIDGDGAVSDKQVLISPGATATFSRLTFSHVRGGIRNFGTLTVADCLYLGNIGGINNTGTLVVTNSTIRDNYSTGVANNGGTVTLMNSTVSHSDISGGVSNYRGTMAIIGSTVRDSNSMYADAAAGISNDGGTLAVTNSAVRGNYSSGKSGSGSGIGNSNGGMVTITNSTVSDNSTTGLKNGSGGFNASSGTMIVTNSTVSGNGFGIFNSSGTVTVTTSTISRNTRPVYNYNGRVVNYGIFNSGTLNLGHSIVAENVIAGDMGGDIIGPFVAQGPNFIGGDPRLGPLQDNGGPTQTMLPLPGSPVINAGGICPVATDQRGVPRPQGVACDIGAVEVGVVAPAPPPRATTAPLGTAPALVLPTRAAGPQATIAPVGTPPAPPPPPNPLPQRR